MISQLKFCAAVMGLSAALAAPAGAGDLTEVFHTCVQKFARSTQAATVKLECIAADGKVSDCKVVEAPTPSNGYDRAALCVAEALPVGTKTGPISFPIKFEKSHY
jgi:flagellar biosynthesis regulator FlbT